MTYDHRRLIEDFFPIQAISAEASNRQGQALIVIKQEVDMIRPRKEHGCTSGGVMVET